MSVYSAPVQAGGAAVLAASAAKAAASGVSRGTGVLAATGASLTVFITVLGFTLLTLGRLLMVRGRGTTLGKPTFD